MKSGKGESKAGFYTEPRRGSAEWGSGFSGMREKGFHHLEQNINLLP